MCRIAGIVSKHDSPGIETCLKRMLNAMAHGGPDDEGVFSEGTIHFGHKRLSIIELSQAGRQPMKSTNDDVVITFNGEIYNYKQLRAELEFSGRKFATRTDTEVILEAYHSWGVSSFDRLQGIFAFALFDKKSRKIFLVRDQIGIKPLYYYRDEDELIFSSEIRGFTALREWKENEDWKILFLAFGSLPFPNTTLKNVFELAPGSYMEFNPDDFSGSIHVYYDPLSSKRSELNKKDTFKMMENAVRDALTKNLIADAPLGIFFSGGIDSSLLTLLADGYKENLKTVSVNFDVPEFDEYAYQKIVLEKTKHVEHTSFRISENMFWDKIDDVWKAMDQPTVDGVNSYFISLCAHNDGLKAVLSGLGADEYFGGYRSFDRVRFLAMIRLLPLKKLISRTSSLFRKTFARLIFLKINGPVGDYLFLRGIYTPDAIAKILGQPERKVWKALQEVKIGLPEKISKQEYISFLESRIYMTNQLLKDTDFMSMWHGLEVRVPFLDVCLLRKLGSISPATRYKRSYPKFLLTYPFRDILPRKIVFRKKQGFTFPFSMWIRKNMMRFSGYLADNEETREIIQQFENGSIHWSKVWCLAVVNQFDVKHAELRAVQL